MDPVNLSETQNCTLNFKSTASNTNPFQCYCGSIKDFAHIFPQAFCFLPPSPGQTKCKHSPDTKEECIPQQQFFQSFPIFPHLLFSNALANLNCPYNNTTETQNEHQKQSAEGSEKLSRPGNVFSHKERCFRMNNASGEETFQKDGPEMPFIVHPFHFSNSPDNAPFQRCGDNIPWACTSFVVPMIPYCVFWNPPIKSNILTGSSLETKQQNQESVELSNSMERTPKTFSPIKDFNNNSTETESADYWGADEGNRWDLKEEAEEGQDSPRSFRSLTLIPSSSLKENSLKNSEQADASEKNLESVEVKVSGDEEEEDDDDDDDEEDTEIDDWEDKEKICSPEDEKKAPNSPKGYPKDPESQNTSTSGSLTDLKVEKNEGTTTEVSPPDTAANPPEKLAEGENARITSPNLQEKYECQETKPRAHYKKANFIKKFINNFTVTDKTSRVREDVQTSTAAAGDLGGVNCVGYKVNIDRPFEDRECKTLQKTRTMENVPTKESSLKGLASQEESKIPQKNPESPPRNRRHFKSGIAKLLNTSKLKEPKGDASKSTKNETKEPGSQELAQKRKHNCYPADQTTGPTTNYSKIQKTNTRNTRLTPRTSQGPEKQVKTARGKSDTTTKREDKISKGKLLKVPVRK